MEDVAIAPQEAATHLSVDPEPAVVVLRSPEQAEQLVLDLIAAHADSLLRTARRYSLCADDAQDAYQRGLEILMRHAARLDADRAGGWLHTVVKHEALAINRSRSRSVGGDEIDFDTIEIRTAPSPEDRVLGFEQVARSAEALQRLKPQEVRALWLKAMGNSYQEICDTTGWSYTKVNRCLAEGRKSFLARYAGIEAGDECRRWAPVLSAMADGEATAEQMLQLRPHLRNCAGCRSALRELRGSNAPLAALFPVGGVALVGGDGGLLSRLWHSLVDDLGERAAAAAFRAQSVAEAVVPGKSMAVFASVAALAGGGFAMDGASHVPTPPRTALSAPSAATAADRLVTRRATPAATRPASTPRRAPKRRPRARVHRKRAAVARPPVRRAPVVSRVRPRRVPPQAAAAAPLAAPARASASPRSGAARAKPAASEFAVETP
jgi:RNA polymerase sigma factor (sigma-70 family)